MSLVWSAKKLHVSCQQTEMRGGEELAAPHGRVTFCDPVAIIARSAGGDGGRHRICS
jgi:hypothetical protein